MYAISDVLRARRFDELWISTLPAHLSKWLHHDLPRRAAREFGLPTRHVVSEPARTARHHPVRPVLQLPVMRRWIAPAQVVERDLQRHPLALPRY